MTRKRNGLFLSFGARYEIDISPFRIADVLCCRRNLGRVRHSAGRVQNPSDITRQQTARPLFISLSCFSILLFTFFAFSLFTFFPFSPFWSISDLKRPLLHGDLPIVLAGRVGNVRRCVRRCHLFDFCWLHPMLLGVALRQSMVVMMVVFGTIE